LKSQYSVLHPALILAPVLCVHLSPLRADEVGEHAADPIVMISGSFGGTPTFGAGITFGREKDRLYVVTANHVVRSGSTAATNLSARLRVAPVKDLAARLLAQFDPVLDLAVLSVDNLAAQGINVCSLSLDRLAVRDAAKRGDAVYPAGNPNGVAWSMPVRPDAVSEVSGDNVVFQSTLIARGHSGGGLISSSGQLIGMIQADEPPYGRALNIYKVLQVLERWNYSIDLNIQTENGDPPLVTAVNESQVERVQHLLKQACVDPNAKSAEFGYAALELAARRGSAEIARLLIDAGANVNAKGHDSSIFNSAAYGGNAEVVRLLTSRGGSCCGTALHGAASRSNVEVVKALLKSGADPNARSGGRSVFYYALTPGFTLKDRATPDEIVRMLVQAGADVNSPDFDDETPLLTAMENKRVASVKLLLEAGANVNARGRNKETALDLAAAWPGDDAHKIAARLVNSSSTTPQESGAKLLERCATEGWTDVADLLTRHGVNVRGQAGAPSLWNATLAGHVQIVKLLLQAGTNPDASPRGNITPLEIVLTPSYGLLGDLARDPTVRLEIVNLLVSRGANVVSHGYDNLSGALFGFAPPDLKVAAFLIAHGANVNETNEGGYTLLDRAVRNSDQAVVDFLVKNGARRGIGHK
jgi:ankyrin repeat protein